MKVEKSQIPGVVDLVRERLSTLGANRDVDLELGKEDYRLEDEWLYLCVAPKSPGIRVSDYAELLAEIEKVLGPRG